MHDSRRRHFFFRYLLRDNIYAAMIRPLVPAVGPQVSELADAARFVDQQDFLQQQAVPDECESSSVICLRGRPFF